MWFGEPHPSPGKRITYQTEHVGTTELQRMIVQNFYGTLYFDYKVLSVIVLDRVRNFERYCPHHHLTPKFIYECCLCYTLPVSGKWFTRWDNANFFGTKELKNVSLNSFKQDRSELDARWHSTMNTCCKKKTCSLFTVDRWLLRV